MMIDIEFYLYTAALAIIALISAVAVFHRGFNDTLAQRIGLSLICIGAVLRLVEIQTFFDHETKSRYLLTYGLALYAMATVFKFWRGK